LKGVWAFAFLDGSATGAWFAQLGTCRSIMCNFGPSWIEHSSVSGATTPKKTKKDQKRPKKTKKICAVT
jgi:hypothetical protein